MCGRFALYANPKEIMRKFAINQWNIAYSLRYNIAPSQNILVVLQPENGEERIATEMRWGLIPAWQKPDQKIRMLNCARLESIETKPSFKKPFFKKRCLILADGFYEWNQETKQPYYIQLANNNTFGMAGIWEKWYDGESSIDSCCILTQNANEKINAYHDRMPVIVQEDNYEAWLTYQTVNAQELKELLIPLTEKNTKLHPVTKSMNTPKFNLQDAIQEINL